jgi:hypothetical protein
MVTVLVSDTNMIGIKAAFFLKEILLDIMIVYYNGFVMVLFLCYNLNMLFCFELGGNVYN